MDGFVKVVNASDLRPGQGTVVSVNGEDVALFNVDGEFHAISNTCPHRGGPLGEGILDGNIVTCPMHGWRFNVKTGQNAIMPASKVKVYKVRIEGNDVLVATE